MEDTKSVSVQLVEILNTAVEKKVYGSVEIFFEEGKITQVTQRTIKKFSNKNKKTDLKKPHNPAKNFEPEIIRTNRVI